MHFFMEPDVPPAQPKLSQAGIDDAQVPLPPRAQWPPRTRLHSHVWADNYEQEEERSDLQPSQVGSSNASLATSNRTSMLVIAQCFVGDTLVALRSSWHHDEHVHASHIKALSLLSLSIVAAMGTIIWLRGVLIPFVLAVVVMLLLEPLLFWLLDPMRSCRRGSTHSGPQRQQQQQQQQQDTRVASFGSGFCFLRERLCRLAGRAWTAVAVVLCILVAVVFIAGCAFFIVRSIQSFSWKKYADSPRLKRLLEQLQKSGASADGISQHSQTLQKIAQGPVMSVVNVFISVVSTMLLMALFLAFLLLSIVDSDPDHHWLGWQAKRQVQRYLRIKSAMSACAGLLTWFVLGLLQVDLAFLWAFLTFLLCFIPHIGYTIAVMLPLPLVFLDPSRTWVDLLSCILWPMLVHQVVTNIVEPRLMAMSLDLHPIIVIVALAFWTLCWGAAGALLSTPLTCFLHLALGHIEHPIAVAMSDVLSGRRLSKHGLG